MTSSNAVVPSAPASTPLSFTFQGASAGRFDLRFADMNYNGMHVRVSLNNGQTLESVVKQELVSTLRGIVARVQGKPGTLVLPEISVSIAETTLSHCTIVVSLLKSGKEQIVVMFRKAVGHVLAAFESPVFVGQQQDAIVEGLKNSILYSLYLPLVNIRMKSDELDEASIGSDPGTTRKKIGILRREINRLSMKCEKLLLPKLKNGNEV